VKVVISQGQESGNIVRISGKNRENFQQNRGKSELSHSQY